MAGPVFRPDQVMQSQAAAGQQAIPSLIIIICLSSFSKAS